MNDGHSPRLKSNKEYKIFTLGVSGGYPHHQSSSTSELKHLDARSKDIPEARRIRGRQMAGDIGAYPPSTTPNCYRIHGHLHWFVQYIFPLSIGLFDYNTNLKPSPTVYVIQDNITDQQNEDWLTRLWIQCNTILSSSPSK